MSESYQARKILQAYIPLAAHWRRLSSHSSRPLRTLARRELKRVEALLRIARTTLAISL